MLAANAVDDSTSTPQNVAKYITISSNDSGTDYRIVTSNTNPSHGTVSIFPYVPGSVWDEWTIWGHSYYDNFGEFYNDWYYGDGESLVWLAYYTPATNYVGSDSFTYTLKDGTGSTDTATVTLTVTGTANQAPTVSLTNKVTSLADTTSTASRIKMADIVVTDDGQGTNTLALTGAQAALFEIFDGDLYLKSGTSLNESVLAQLTVNVTVDDTTVGGTPDSSATLNVAVYTPLNAVNDSVSTDYEEPVEIDFLANDTGYIIRIDDYTQPQHGDVEIRPDVAQSFWDEWLSWAHLSYSSFEAYYGGEVDWYAVYVPDTGYSGNDSFTYTLRNEDDDTDTATVSIVVLPLGNQAPMLTLSNLVTSLAENADNSQRIRVADITITDDGLGTNTLGLTGADAAHFEIDAGKLYLKANSTLDYETRTSYAVAVTVNDPEVGGTPDDSENFTLSIQNINDVAPTLALTNVRTAPLPETDFFTVREKVADVVVTDDGAGTNVLSLSGDDADLFEIVAGGLYLKAGAIYDFDANPQLDVTVDVDDATFGSGPDDSEAFSLEVANGNQAPSISLSNIVSPLPEDTDTTAAVLVADIVIEDDETAGVTQVWLVGADAEYFEIVDDQLFLKAGTELDYETKDVYRVTIAIDDITIGGQMDDTTRLKLEIGNVNDAAPTVEVVGLFSSPISEFAPIPAPLKVADIVVTDDGAGENELTLSGDDAALFEIADGGLYLKANTVLDYETNPVLDVTVHVDDPEFGTGIDSSDSFSLSVADANEAPEIALDNVVDELPEDTDLTTALVVADIVISDDTLGTAELSLIGRDSDQFEIVDEQLLLKAGTVLDYESAAELRVTIVASDAESVGADSRLDFVLTVTNVNDEPPRVSLVNVRVAPLPEGETLTEPLKVADIVIRDDGLGTNTLSLAGADAALFEVDETGLSLKAGTVPDYETLASLTVDVVVSDATFDPGLADSTTFRIAIGDVNEAPGISLVDPLTSLPENQQLNEALLVATLDIQDDRLGHNAVTLSGDDAGLFELLGDQLFLKAGTQLDHETNPVLNVTIEVDDEELGAGVEASASLAVAVANVDLAARDDVLRVENTFREEPVELSLLDNDFFDGAGTLRIVSITGALHGTLDIVDNSGNSAHDEVTYTPDADFVGTETLTYIVEDSDENQSTGTVTLHVVRAVDANQAPLAPEIHIRTAPEEPVEFTILSHISDFEGDDLTLVSISAPIDGTLTSAVNGQGQTVYTYTPDSEFTGTETLSYTVADEHGATATSTVVIVVGNIAPVALPDKFRVEEGTTLVVNQTVPGTAASVLVNDIDLDGQTLTATLVDDVEHGTLVFNADGTFTYTPDALYVGTDSFTYKVNDGYDDSAVQTVTITVFPEVNGTGDDNGRDPYTPPDPHEAGGESDTGIIVLHGGPPLDPTRPFTPPEETDDGGGTTSIDDTIETEDGDITDTTDREIDITRSFDAVVNTDGSWSYSETYTAAYNLSTTSSDGSLVTLIGAYSYTVTASGDDESSTFTLYVTNSMTATGSFTSSWSGAGNSGSVDYNWSQSSLSHVHVTNFTNFETGLSSGTKTEHQHQTQNYLGAGTYAYDIDGGQVTGVISSGGTQVSTTSLAGFYSGGPLGWSVFGFGSSSSIGTDFSSRHGSGDYFLQSDNEEGFVSQTNGSLVESGTEHSASSLAAFYSLTAGGWVMTHGSGLTSSFGQNHQATDYSGSYTSLIPGGSMVGEFSGNSRDDSHFTSAVITVGAAGEWTTSGTSTMSGHGDSANSSAGQGNYEATREEEDLTSNVVGQSEQNSSDSSNYSFTSVYQLDDGEWELSSGSGMSFGQGDSFSSVFETSSYSRIIRNAEDEQEGSVQGNGVSQSREKSDYTWNASSLVVDGQWTESGTFESNEEGKSAADYEGSGSYARDKDLEDGTAVDFVGTLIERGKSQDEYDTTSNGILAGGEWVQTDGTGEYKGQGGSNSEYMSGAGSTYTRTIKDANNLDIGQLVGTAHEHSRNATKYNYSVDAEFVDAAWVRTGERNDESQNTFDAGYNAAQQFVKTDNNDDEHDSVITYNVTENGEQHSTGDAHMQSVLDALGSWVKFVGSDDSDGYGKSHSETNGSGTYDQAVVGGRVGGSISEIKSVNDSDFNYRIQLGYGVPAAGNTDGLTGPASDWYTIESERKDNSNSTYNYTSSGGGYLTRNAALSEGPSGQVTGNATQSKVVESKSDQHSTSRWYNPGEEWLLTGGEGRSNGEGDDNFNVTLTGTSPYPIDQNGNIVSANITVVNEIIGHHDFNETLEVKVPKVGEPGYGNPAVGGAWKFDGNRNETLTYRNDSTSTGSGTYQIPPPAEGEVVLTETGTVSLDYEDKFKKTVETKFKRDYVHVDRNAPIPDFAKISANEKEDASGKNLVTYAREATDPAGLTVDGVAFQNVQLTRTVTSGVESWKSNISRDQVIGLTEETTFWGHWTGGGTTTSILGQGMSFSGKIAQPVSVEGFTNLPGTLEITQSETITFKDVLQTAYNTAGELHEVSNTSSVITGASTVGKLTVAEYLYARPAPYGTGTVYGTVTYTAEFEQSDTFNHNFQRGVDSPIISGDAHSTGNSKSTLQYEGAGAFVRGTGAFSPGFVAYPGHGVASEYGGVEESGNFKIDYTLEVANNLWRLSGGEGKTSSSAAHHADAFGFYTLLGGNVSTSSGDGVGGVLPSWADRPAGEEYNGEDGEGLPWYESDFFGGFQYTGGNSTSTVTQLRQSSEFRSRDWGSSYSTEHHLVPISGSPNLEWDSTGSGNSFLTGIASYTSAHIDGQSVDYVYSGSAGGNSFDHTAGYVESRSLTSGWDKNYSRQNTYELAEVSTGTYGWRKTLGTEELHATAFAVAEFSFASEWDYNTSGGSWSEAHTGYAQLDLTEQADSYYDLSQTTTYDAYGSPSFTGTKAYGRDVTSELIRDIEDWHDEAGSTGSDGGIYTWTSDSYEFGHSWSQNLETSAITTDSYNSVAGEIDWSHGQGLYGLPIGWEDYEFEYEMTVAPPGGGMSHIAGAHGLNPETLYLLDSPGTLPTSSHFVDANFEVPENMEYEAPPTFEDTFGEEEEVSNGSEVEQGKGWLHFATGFIPIYGSARDMYESFQNKEYGWMVANGVFLAVDLFTLGIGGAAIKGATKLGIAGVKAGLKAGLREGLEGAVKQGVKRSAGYIDDVAESGVKNLGKNADEVAQGVLAQSDNAAGVIDDAAEFASSGEKWASPPNRDSLQEAGELYNDLLQRFKQDGGILDVNKDKQLWSRGDMVNGLYDFEFLSHPTIRIGKGATFGTRLEELIHHQQLMDWIAAGRTRESFIRFRSEIEKQAHDILRTFGFTRVL